MLTDHHTPKEHFLEACLLSEVQENITDLKKLIENSKNATLKSAEMESKYKLNLFQSFV